MRIAQVGIFAITLNATEAVKITNNDYTDSLAQTSKQSIPACNSSVFPNCVREAETAAPQKL